MYLGSYPYLGELWALYRRAGAKAMEIGLLPAVPSPHIPALSFLFTCQESAMTALQESTSHLFRTSLHFNHALARALRRGSAKSERRPKLPLELVLTIMKMAGITQPQPSQIIHIPCLNSE